MTTLGQTRTEQDRVAEKIKKVQQLYADAPEVGRVALKNGSTKERSSFATSSISKKPILVPMRRSCPQP